MIDSPAISESSAAAYCAARVRSLDRDRYLVTLFAARDQRDALCALYAFNIELGAIREAVSEPGLGRIRLQWWRDTLDGVFAGTPRHHAVAVALGSAVSRFGLSRPAFERMIDARERDLENAPPESLAALEAYAAGTSGALTQLALQALGADGEAAARAGCHAGTAWALLGLLRAAGFHARQRRCYLPQALMAEAGTGEAELFALKGGEGLDNVARRIAECARQHMVEARRLHHAIPRPALAAMLPMVLADGYLRRMERLGFRLFADLGPSPPVRHARLLLAALRGRY